MARTAPFLLLALVAMAAGTALAGTTPGGKAYLEANKLKEGVSETKSGLQYRVLASGKEVRARGGVFVRVCVVVCHFVTSLSFEGGGVSSRIA
jgi:hypothetical protein